MSSPILICGSDNPIVENGLYFIGYSDLVDGYRHAYVVSEWGRRKLRRSRDAGHPADPRCPGCQELNVPPRNPDGPGVPASGSGGSGSGRSSTDEAVTS